MRDTINITLLCLASFCFALTVAKADTLPDTLVLVTDNYEPYSSTQNNGSGVIADIVRAAFAAVNVKVEYRFASWQRCEILVASGEAYGAIPYFKNEERELHFDFSVPILYGFTRFYYNNKRFPEGLNWHTLEDFQGYRMGGILGYWYMPEYRDFNLDIHLVNTEEQNFIKLAKDRIDFALTGQPIAERIIRNLPDDLRDTISALEKPESKDAFYVLVSRTYPEASRYNALMTEGLKKIIASGDYLDILSRYQLSPEYAVAPP